MEAPDLSRRKGAILPLVPYWLFLRLPTLMMNRALLYMICGAQLQLASYEYTTGENRLNSIRKE